MSVKVDGRSIIVGVRRVLGSIWTRGAVSVALVAFVATRLNWSQMGQRLSAGHPEDFAAALALVVLALVVGALRWRRLLQVVEVPLPLPQLGQVYAVATFSNTFLPTSVGGDVTRALLVSRRGPKLVRVALTVVVDRLAALAGLIGLAWIAFALHPGAVPHGSQTFLRTVTVGLAIATVVLAVAVYHGGFLGRLVPRRLVDNARLAYGLLRICAGDPQLIFFLLVTSIVYQALIALQLVMLADAIGVSLSFATGAVALTLVTIVTLLPISIGGFGVREGTYVVLLAGAGIAATDAALISVLSVATLFVASLPGAYLLARGRVSVADDQAVPLSPGLAGS